VAHLFRIERNDEVAPNADAMYIGVAVRKGRQRIASRQPLECRQHVLEKGHIVASVDEDSESLIGNRRVVLMLECEAPQGFDAQPGHVMRSIRPFLYERHTPRIQILRCKSSTEHRVLLLQECRHTRLRALQHRPHLPKGVIEIETNGAHVAEHRKAADVQSGARFTGIAPGAQPCD